MNPFAQTSVVAFELSNLCNYSRSHAKCPLSREKAPVILDGSIVRAVLHHLHLYNWEGMINFHQYNEPLIDPRLVDFIKSARNACPGSKIEIVTNGWYLTPELAHELADAGVTKLLITPYDRERAFQLAEMILAIRADHIAVDVLDYPLPGLLDDRMQIYDRAPAPRPLPCRAPLAHVTITCRGSVALCCQDWARTVTFGNLREQTIGDILMSAKAQTTYRRLSSGDRFLDVCQRCDSGQGI